MLVLKIVYMLENPDIIKKTGIEPGKKAERESDANERIRKILTVYSRVGS
jgi:hypothetical protein